LRLEDLCFSLVAIANYSYLKVITNLWWSLPPGC
jgi:hypothetical protein